MILSPNKIQLKSKNTVRIILVHILKVLLLRRKDRSSYHDIIAKYFELTGSYFTENPRIKYDNKHIF